MGDEDSSDTTDNSGFGQNWLPAVTIKSVGRSLAHSGGERISLTVGSGRTTARIRSVLNALGGVVIGVGIFMIGALVTTIFSGSMSDFLLLGAISFLCVLGGVTFGYLSWKAWTRDFYLQINETGLKISYVGFNRPMVVPKELVRVVSIDETNGAGRFPMESRTVEAQRSVPEPGSVFDAGWAAAIRTNEGPSLQPQESEYLYSPRSRRGDSGMAFLKLNPEDSPNIAILFHESIDTPKAPLGVDFPGHRTYGGGRKVPGVMMTLVQPDKAKPAFSGWKVLRPINSQDVFEEGLFRPSKFSPRLRGAIFAIGILILWLLRIVFDFDDFGLL